MHRGFTWGSNVHGMPESVYLEVTDDGHLVVTDGSTPYWCARGCDVAVRTYGSYYLAAEGYADAGGDRPNGEVNAPRQALGPREAFTISYRGAGNIALWSIYGRAMIAWGEGGSGLSATVQTAREWETFTPEKLDDGKLGLRTYNGHYVVAEHEGGGDVNANRPHLREWETFRLELLSPL